MPLHLPFGTRPAAVRYLTRGYASLAHDELDTGEEQTEL